jgi:small GTP-binding protein
VSNRALNFDHAFKVLILGDPAVGKSSLVRRFVHGKFSADYLMTIGMEPYSRYETIQNSRICYAIWDIAGADNFRVMHRIYFQGAVGSLVAFDVTRRESFENVDEWVADARSAVPNQFIVLLGNKTDLVNHQVSKQEGLEKVNELKLLGYMETSALSGANVDSAFNFLGSRLLDRFGKGI